MDFATFADAQTCYLVHPNHTLPLCILMGWNTASWASWSASVMAREYQVELRCHESALSMLPRVIDHSHQAIASGSMLTRQPVPDS